MSELYREKIESLQAEESRLLAQKAAAQSAAAETVRQAEKDGAALVSQAQEAARRAAADALRQAEAQAEAHRDGLRGPACRGYGADGRRRGLPAGKGGEAVDGHCQNEAFAGAGAGA